jgi:hypothetical protein
LMVKNYSHGHEYNTLEGEEKRLEILAVDGAFVNNLVAVK